MLVTVLGSGTSQGVPVIACDCEVCQSLDFRDQRLRPSIHIADGDLSLVVDTGPDFRQQMLREGIKHVDAVLFTHEHKDHTAGFDDLRSFNFRQSADIPIYAREQVMTQLKQEFAYIFTDPSQKYPGVLNVEEHLIENNKPLKFKHLEVEPIEVLHYRLPVYAFRIGDFVYATDVNNIPPDSFAKMQGAKVIILDALQREDHISHFTLSQAVEVLQELQPEQAYLTHISHKLGKHAEVEAELPDNIRLAYDGLKIHL